jgi:hypothetical protein
MQNTGYLVAIPRQRRVFAIAKIVSKNDIVTAFFQRTLGYI